MMMTPPVPCSMRVGIAALAVWKAPVRLTSSVSCHCSGVISQDRLAEQTPALAITTSTRPSSATPACSASDNAPKSRTSASTATMRRPWS